ncbi:unnamed protein product, partial [Symbiodinium necroappetens]
YPHLGITCAMVGTWKDAPAGSCMASACSDAGNTATLLSGSTAYPDMCKAVPTTTTADASETSMAPSLFMSAALSAAFSCLCLFGI